MQGIGLDCQQIVEGGLRRPEAAIKLGSVTGWFVNDRKSLIGNLKRAIFDTDHTDYRTTVLSGRLRCSIWYRMKWFIYTGR